MYWRETKRFASANLLTNTFAPELQPAIDWLLQFKVQTSNLLIFGDVGTGKTHLAHAALNTMAANQRKKFNIPDTNAAPLNGIVYATLKQILDDIRAEWKVQERSIYDTPAFEMYATPKLLIVDEVGATYGTDSDRLELLPLFNYRWEQMLPTVLMGNTLPDMSITTTLNNNLGLRITDRIMDGAVVIQLRNKSRRVNNEKIPHKDVPTMG